MLEKTTNICGSSPIASGTDDGKRPAEGIPTLDDEDRSSSALPKLGTRCPASVSPRSISYSSCENPGDMAQTSEIQAAGELSAWLAKYEPVERAVIEAHERRLANRVRRNAERREADARAFGDLCEATEGFAVIWRREGWSVRDMVCWADGDVLTLSALARWVRKDATERIDRARGRLRRPLYYAREKARRQALAEERHRVGRRRTTNPCPSREEILEAWAQRQESHEAAVRFGSMIHDLECYVDNSLLRDEGGAIVGRRGGVKAWLQENIPALYVRYTTVMRYKAMAKKLRQVVGLADPVPAEAVLAERTGESMTGGRSATKDGECGKVATPGLAVVRARAVWLEIIKDVRGTSTALIERVDALSDPERVEEANMLAELKAKYENEITVRRKSLWWQRMRRESDKRQKWLLTKK